METNFKTNATQLDSLEAMKLQIILSALNPTIQCLAEKLKGEALPVIYYTLLKTAFDSAYYEGDTDEHQTVKDALRLIEDERANCVDYSVFIGTFLLLLDIPFTLRMVSFGNSDEWTHVYIVTPDGFSLDAVLGQNMDGNEFKLRNGRQPIFNKEVPYKYKHDLNF